MTRRHSVQSKAGMLEACALSDKGCIRTNNEDYYMVRPEAGLFVLADGMGGAKGGERASRIAVDAVAEIVLGAGESRDSQTLLRAVEEANQRVMEAARQDPKLEGMGTTLVAALVNDGEMAIASVGDSRAYLLDERGFRAITEDQTWVNDVGRPLGLDEESLRRHPMRHVLTMAIGAGTSLSINYYSVRLERSGILLLSSDGLHGVVEPEKIESILRDESSAAALEAKCRRLIDAARTAGGPDNITAILVRIR